MTSCIQLCRWGYPCTRIKSVSQLLPCTYSLFLDGICQYLLLSLLKISFQQWLTTMWTESLFLGDILSHWRPESIYLISPCWCFRLILRGKVIKYDGWHLNIFSRGCDKTLSSFLFISPSQFVPWAPLGSVRSYSFPIWLLFPMEEKYSQSVFWAFLTIFLIPSQGWKNDLIYPPCLGVSCLVWICFSLFLLTWKNVQWR
jgi:hypothetical protein